MKKIRFGSLALAIAALLVSMGPTLQVFAERISSNVSETQIRNTLQTLTSEARAAHAGQVLYQCFKLSKDGSTIKGTTFEEDFDDVIVGSMTTGGTRGVGAWLEKKVGGEVEDGAIYCDENNVKLAEVFAKQIGLKKDDIICGKGNVPGTFRKKDKNGECDTSSSAKHEWNPGWNSYLASIYDDYAEKNNWKYRWAQVGSDSWVYPDVIGYTMYVAEISEGCGKSAGATKPSSSYISVPVDFVNENGEISDDWYYGSDGAYVVPETSNSKHHAFVSRATNATCKEMVGFANEKATYFQAEIFELIKDGCKGAYKAQYDKAKERVDGGTTNEQLTNAIAEYEAMEAAGEFTEATAKGGLQCKDTQYLANVSQLTWVDADPGDDPSVAEPSCYDNAGSLGWIVCPITQGLSDVIQDVYESMIVPFLEVDVGLFSGGAGANNVFSAWQIFQGMANLAFVIIFIIVIFSQVSGFGIDNYGIKKILPKLIVGGILINLSYIICEIAIDIANIAGNGIEGIFNGIQDGLAVTTVAADVGATGAGVAIAGGAGVALAAAIAAAIVVPAVLTQGLGVIIPILLALLSVVISIIFLFVLLSIRQALTVILVVISPLAFACYMLPNTKKLFDKWLNALKGMLLAYPICSALVYGGQAVGYILIAANGTAGTGVASIEILISSAVISIVPIFLIPGMIKKSMGAISGMVAKAQSKVGQRAHTGAERGLAHTNLGRRRAFNMKAADDRRNAKTSEYNARRGQSVVDKLNKRGIKTAGDRRRYNSALAMVSAQEDEKANTYSAGFVGKSDKAIIKSLTEAANNGTLDSSMMSAAFSSINNENHVAEAYAAISGTDAFKGVMADSRSRSRVANSLLGRKGSIINQSLGKIVGATEDGEVATGSLDYKKLTEGETGGRLGEKIRAADTSVMASQDKDVFETMGAAKFFSAEQLNAAIGAGYTGGRAESFNGMLKGTHADSGAVSDARKAEMLSKISAEQLSGIDDGTVTALGGGAHVASQASGAVQMLNASEGDNLRAGMNSKSAEMLGVKAGGDTPAAAPTEIVVNHNLDHSRVNKDVMGDLAKRYPRQQGEGTQAWADRIYRESGVRIGNFKNNQ